MILIDGKLLIMTPIDPALLLIPILQSTTLVRALEVHNWFTLISLRLTGHHQIFVNLMI
jgi:hypothetical protein